MDHLTSILSAQKSGQPRGITSICSAHPMVLKAAMQMQPACLLIESTCNQVNQFGGYTGMTPAGFVRYIREIAADNNYPFENIILGGDHLGPNVWQNEPADSAMQRSADMISDYVKAGYQKIHLDCSMRLGDDPEGPLSPETAAQRAAFLAKIAESVFAGSAPRPRYVIGTEVPVPGGAKEHEETVSVTRAEDADQTIRVTRDAFLRAGLESAWERVLAVVVQPGVEFGDDFVVAYQPEAARELSRFIESQPIIYEAHSTDYQTREALASLVRDHFAILKVGPGLTFAFREAVFALAMIENELFDMGERSNMVQVLEEAMLRNPEHWRKYYHGTLEQQAFARKFSLSDRVRYYWPDAQVQAALAVLMKNLGRKPLPMSLLGQFVPGQSERIRRGEMACTPEAILLDRVQAVLRDYQAACGM